MKGLIVFAVLSIVSANSYGENLNLEEKWSKMLVKANTYQEYKVIKITELTSLWKAVQAHVATQDLKLSQERSIISQQQIKIIELEKNQASLNERLTSISNEKDTMSFLGKQVNKYTYATMLWILMSVIVIGAGILFFLFKSSNKLTVQKVKDFADLSKAFEEYRQCKIEVEKKLKRELQTYLNKSEDLRKERAGFGRGQ